MGGNTRTDLRPNERARKRNEQPKITDYMILLMALRVSQAGDVHNIYFNLVGISYR